MKIKDSTLRQIIREEYSRLINEEEEKEKPLTREQGLKGIVSDNKGAGTLSSQGSAMVQMLIDTGNASAKNVKSVVNAYSMDVTSAQKKAVGL